MERTQQLQATRPVLELEKKENMSPEEVFQNSVLRPILMFQNDLLCLIFQNEVTSRKHKLDFSSPKTLRSSIEGIVKKDQKIKAKIVQTVAALMTVEEYHQYEEKQSELNRRIVSMSIERLSDQIKRTENA